LERQYKNKELLQELIVNQNLSYNEVSRRLNCSDITLRKWCNILGIKRDLTPEYEKLDELHGDDIVDKYSKGNSMLELSLEYNTTSFAINKILLNHNITKREKSEIQSIANKKYMTKGKYGKKYDINENYFKTISSNMVYILGFLSADGYINNDLNFVRIALQENDRQLLELIKNELKYEGEIKSVKRKVKNKEYDVCVLTVCNKTIVEDLKKFNIVNNKSLILKVPYDKIPKEYWIDYIRGIFDGDGSVKVRKKQESHNTHILIEFSSGSKECIEDLTFMLHELGISKFSIRESKTSSGNSFYEITISTLPSKELYNLMYYNNDLICLKRKKEKIKNGFLERERFITRI
jgi:hypothetical protein